MLEFLLVFIVVAVAFLWWRHVRENATPARRIPDPPGGFKLEADDSPPATPAQAASLSDLGITSTDEICFEAAQWMLAARDYVLHVLEDFPSVQKLSAEDRIALLLHGVVTVLEDPDHRERAYSWSRTNFLEGQSDPPPDDSCRRAVARRLRQLLAA